ncbi:hypothetical protein BN7_6057 [Wickerhamomyces ciferrii]|uniref:Gfd2/YDR514C-like C-terminal domain-containing protein n=1 Tax=Wickerhamomyces ciferrii (strain ATCC 14091 / BCRC 22168 / CBS 111 / JCM 3599 / NBRC 0793 / NRRL Y-1031 F-60-10) TaxID=1206466 RepID=K0KYE6_WICCF|nr:uncharacterized protein BN7_6057 [Wickerhamomyces ciferrii]CCH46464.1 hypothetical protein BN7_6057 [Wickerhamomyces ciferrii]
MLCLQRRSQVILGHVVPKILTRFRSVDAIKTQENLIDDLDTEIADNVFEGEDDKLIFNEKEFETSVPLEYSKEFESRDYLKNLLVHRIQSHSYKETDSYIKELSKRSSTVTKTIHKIEKGTAIPTISKTKYDSMKRTYKDIKDKSVPFSDIIQVRDSIEPNGNQILNVNSIFKQNVDHEIIPSSNAEFYKTIYTFNGKKQKSSTKSKLSPFLKSLIEDIKKNFLLESNFGSSKIYKTKRKITEDYLNDLNNKRIKHPTLRFDDIFNELAEVLRIVNSGKVTLIGIDCEFNPFGEPKQIGIAIYHPPGSTSIFPDIKSFHIIIEEDHIHHNSGIGQSCCTFLAGNSLILKRKEAIKLLNVFIEIYFQNNSKSKSQNHQGAAFVCHGYEYDFEGLTKMGVSFPEKLTIIDTHQLYVCSHGIKASGTSTLSSINKRFNLLQSFAHNAGNDAYYSLMLLLRLSDPAFRKAQKLDDFIEDYKYEHQWTVDSLKMKEMGFFPKVFEERDPIQWNIYEFSPPKEMDDAEDAIKFAFNRQYKT